MISVVPSPAPPAPVVQPQPPPAAAAAPATSNRWLIIGIAGVVLASIVLVLLVVLIGG
jgi:hypothetical protein